MTATTSADLHLFQAKWRATNFPRKALASITQTPLPPPPGRVRPVSHFSENFSFVHLFDLFVVLESCDSCPLLHDSCCLEAAAEPSEKVHRDSEKMDSYNCQVRQQVWMVKNKQTNKQQLYPDLSTC